MDLVSLFELFFIVFFGSGCLIFFFLGIDMEMLGG